MSGFYLMHRGWQENPLFGREPFSRRDAWVWMIEQAAYAERAVNIAGKTVAIHRGQFSSSLRFMARAWGWDEARVRRFLSRAQKEKMIDAGTDAGQTVITICNYDEYQIPVGLIDAGPDAPATQQRRGGDAKYNEGNITSGDKSPDGKTRTREAFDLPERIPAQPWADFLAMRRRIGKPMTTRAMELAVAELDKLAADGWPPGDVLNNSTLNSYQGLFPPKDKTNAHRQSRTGSAAGDIRGRRPNPLVDALAQAERELAAGDSADDPQADFGTWPALPAVR